MKKLYILSAGTPTPTPHRFGSSFVLQLDDSYLMFDCGPAATHKLVKVGLTPLQIEHLFFTHHHFDHNADYPCFLLCRWDQSIHSTPRLHVRGPAPTVEITGKLIGGDGAFAADLRARIHSPASHAVYANRGGVLPRPEPTVDVQDIDSDFVHEGGEWRVRAARGQHMEPYLTLLTYRVDYKGFSIVFGSDTKPCSPPIDLATGADVLVLTCWDHQHVVDRDAVGEAMSGTRDVAQIAGETAVKKLVLTHFCQRFTKPDSLEQAEKDIRAIYGGEIIFGEELMGMDL